VTGATTATTLAFALSLALPELAQAQTAAPTPAPGPAASATSSTEKPVAVPPGPTSGIAAQAAKEAELTPILAAPKNVTHTAYQLFAETDLPLLGIGLVLASSRLVRTQPAYCAPLCNPADLNPLDRTTAGFWNVGWSTVSDVGIYSLMGLAAAVLVVDEGALPALNDAVVVAESALSATALSSLVTVAAGRPRPFLYGEKAPLADRNSADGGLSFLSSHATVSFAIATSMYITERRLHPGAAFPYLVLGAGIAMASFIGTARVMAGRHFITDSIGGAIVGTSIGVLVPALHGSPVTLAPTVTPTQGSLSVVGAF
jgi:membrane-associated phospholipid phosphatase